MASKSMTFGLITEDKKKSPKRSQLKYWVSDHKGGRYNTSSIVKARAYAAKMVMTNTHGWMWWDIYYNGGDTLKGSNKAYSTVVYNPESRTLQWYVNNSSWTKKYNMNADGTLRRS